MPFSFLGVRVKRSDRSKYPRNPKIPCALSYRLSARKPVGPSIEKMVLGRLDDKTAVVHVHLKVLDQKIMTTHTFPATWVEKELVGNKVEYVLIYGGK